MPLLSQPSPAQMHLPPSNLTLLPSPMPTDAKLPGLGCIVDKNGIANPPNYRLSCELDELLQWEGLNRPHFPSQDGVSGDEHATALLEYDEENEDTDEMEKDLFEDGSMSYSSLSNILASARRKLDLLEGNLKGARHSLLTPTLCSPVSTTSSLRSTRSSSISKASSSVSSEEGNHMQPQATQTKSSLERHGRSDHSLRNDPGHGRFLSESSVPSSNRSNKTSRCYKDISNRNQDFHQASIGLVSQSTHEVALSPVTEVEIPPIWSLSRHKRMSSNSDKRSSTTAKKERYGVNAKSPKIRGLRDSGCESDSEEYTIVGDGQAVNQSTDAQSERSTAPSLSDEQQSSDESDHACGPRICPCHEDRLDAFDYERFILHSALGTYSTAAIGQVSETSSVRSSSTTRGASDGTTEPSSDRRKSSSIVQRNTELDNSSSDEVYDSDSDDSDHDLADLEGSWPMPPASSVRPQTTTQPALHRQSKSYIPAVIEHLGQQTAPRPEKDIRPSPAASSVAALEENGKQSLRTRENVKRTRENMRAPILGQVKATPINTSQVPAAPPNTPNTAPLASSPGLNDADQALAYAFAEAFRDACLRLREGGEDEKNAWRQRLVQARKVLKSER